MILIFFDSKVTRTRCQMIKFIAALDANIGKDLWNSKNKNGLLKKLYFRCVTLSLGFSSENDKISELRLTEVTGDFEKNTSPPRIKNTRK